MTFRARCRKGCVDANDSSNRWRRPNLIVDMKNDVACLPGRWLYCVDNTANKAARPS